MRSTRASVRHFVRIAAPAARIWPFIGDPTRLTEWFPGIVECRVEGSQRTITTHAGLSMTETLLTNNPLEHRFQYRITTGLVREHLSTIDVLDLGDGTSVVQYSCDADPAPLALMIAGGALDGLRTLQRLVEED